MTLVHNAISITVSPSYMERNPLRINYILLKVGHPLCEEGEDRYRYSNVYVAS